MCAKYLVRSRLRWLGTIESELREIKVKRLGRQANDAEELICTVQAGRRSKKRVSMHALNTRATRWANDVVRMEEMINSHTILVGNLKG
jgi:hypothetical protein